MKFGPFQLLLHLASPFLPDPSNILCCPFCAPLSVAHLVLPYHQHGGLQCSHLYTENGASGTILTVLNGESTIHVTKSGDNESLFVPQREHQNRPCWIESKGGIRHVLLLGQLGATRACSNQSHATGSISRHDLIYKESWGVVPREHLSHHAATSRQHDIFGNPGQHES